ncbi:AbrB/MazE/SpoVT family DNA-binding domain-containing protein [Pantoea dispersa]|uniref:AbrB/MazE/SpoVT family DNA-binding domain-containing protein n=1 Tax=Pantoea dispersa TaxID=59814 RepID=UPI001CA7B1E0|nr:antitoxin [Pantoea dispersa]QZY97572.1 antitoxin [Pantoea dispersa]
MTDLTLRQQNDILVITVPDDVVDLAGWTPGIQLNVTVEGETVTLTPASHLPLGRKKLAHLLSGIDQSETHYLNEESHDGLNDAPQGKESI